MSIPDPHSLDYLLQTDVLENIIPNTGKGMWITLYQNETDNSGKSALWCALLDDDAAEQALESPSWDLFIGDGRPSFSQQGWGGEDSEVRYHPHGGEKGIRYLVRCRNFLNAYSPYCELDQEFRLYHNLAHDYHNNRYLAFDDSGREIEVAKIISKNVEVQLKYLRQFQAGVGLHLAIYGESVRYSNVPLEQVREKHYAQKGENSLVIRDIVDKEFGVRYSTLSRVLFKVILPPPPRNKAGIWPFIKKEKEVEFIIGVNDDGDNIEFTSNPDKLSNYFGANPGAPNYLRPVFFRRKVLDKYLAEPSRYKVEDGHIRCGGLWLCKIDNDSDSSVNVFLGDLGRDLPYEERLHWRQYNIPPDGQISEVNFRRSFQAEWAESTAPDLVFRGEYEQFSNDWEVKFGWPFFRPLDPNDSYVLSTLHVPSTNEQNEMDKQVGFLAKLLVDSLNETALLKHSSVSAEGIEGSINKLKVYLEAHSYSDVEKIILLLRSLQSLRSTGVAHNKGSNYYKKIAKLDIDLNQKALIVEGFIQQSVKMLRNLRSHFIDKQE